jgi:O-antigen/teichoic acid export membrane protein
VGFAVDAVVSTLIFPLLLKHLGKTEAGLWMLFGSMGALFSCVTSGLSPVTSRCVASTLGQSNTTGATSGLLAKARVSIQRVYRLALGVSMVAAVAAVPLYLSSVARKIDQAVLGLACAWLAYIIGWGLRGVMQKNFSIMDGLGAVGLSRVVNTTGGLVNLAILLLLLRLDLGLWAPVVSYLVVSIGLWGGSLLLLKRELPSVWYDDSNVSWAETRDMAGEAARMLVLGMTAYIVGQSCILFVERSHGVESLALLAPVARIVALMSGAACLPHGMIFPYLARAFSSGDGASFKRLSRLVLVVAPLLYSVPASVLFLYPQEILSLWLGEGNFIGAGTTRLLLVYGLVFSIHCGVAIPALATRHRHFVRESILNMLLVAGLMPLCAHFWGIPGYPAAMIVGTLIPSVIVCWQSIRFLRGRV